MPPFADPYPPKTTLARADLAEQALEGLVSATAYRATAPWQCTHASTAVRSAPSAEGAQEDQLIFGELFDVLDQDGSWAWGRARRDGYVGFVALEALSVTVQMPTHRVAALRTYGYARPDFRAEPVILLSLNALVSEQARDGRFVQVAGAGWIASEHLADFTAFDDDLAAVAERFVGAPYQWGGRESLGLDCSGLVQQALYACGRASPRDTDEQEAELGHDIPVDQIARGDLVFWPGHVAIMVDSERVLHANSHHMAVAIEPLAAAAARQRASGVGEPSAYRRL